MDKKVIFYIGILSFIPFIFSVKIGMVFSQTHGDLIAAIITVGIFSILILSYFAIYKLGQRRREIEKQVDAYFENKEK